MPTDVLVPPMGESVNQAKLLKWHKADGDVVQMDDMLCELETDKANVDVPSTGAGVLKQLKKEGDVVLVGEAVARVDAAVAGAKPAAAAIKAPAGNQSDRGASKETTAREAATLTAKPVAPQDLSPAVRAMVADHGLSPAQMTGTGPKGRITKEDAEGEIERQGNGHSVNNPPVNEPEKAVSVTPPSGPEQGKAAPQPAAAGTDKRSNIATTPAKSGGQQSMTFDNEGVHRAAMSPIRKRIATTLVQAQQTAALLTTFNEVDMTAIMDLRTKYKERFQGVHGVGLGFMSFFARACVLALKEYPRVNAFIDGSDVVYHRYVHLGIAVSTERGLAVPVLRNVQDMSMARIEAEIKRLATAVREGKLGINELSGGTFTITNGGVFGSLLSTPIINPPQSGILGMHAITKRAMVVNDRIEIRQMMYLALTYDHRLVDGRESVSFLVKLKQLLEDPARLMLEI